MNRFTPEGKTDFSARNAARGGTSLDRIIRPGCVQVKLCQISIVQTNQTIYCLVSSLHEKSAKSNSSEMDCTSPNLATFSLGLGGYKWYP